MTSPLKVDIIRNRKHTLLESFYSYVIAKGQLISFLLPELPEPQVVLHIIKGLRSNLVQEVSDQTIMTIPQLITTLQAIDQKHVSLDQPPQEETLEICQMGWNPQQPLVRQLNRLMLDPNSRQICLNTNRMPRWLKFKPK